MSAAKHVSFHHNPFKRACLALGAISSLPFALAVGAQAQETKTLDAVIVTGASINGDYAVRDASTATKTDTPLIETPMSIQVIPLQVLEDQKATTLDQALTNVSGVLANSKLAGGWAEQIYLRGFSTNSTFRDGFRIDDATWDGRATLSNIDSIEVLKGPAAILYGRVEPGGVVNMVTKKPQDTPHEAVEQSFGSWNHSTTSFDATNAINDDKTLLYRLNATYETSQSWREAIYDRRVFVAPSIQWKLSPHTQITLDASYSHNPKVMDIGYYPVDQTTNQFAPIALDKNPVPIYYTADTSYAGISWSHQFNDDWSLKQQIRHNGVVGSYPLQAIVSDVYQNGNVWTFDRTLYQTEPQQITDATIVDLTGHFSTKGIDHTMLAGMDYYRFRSVYGLASSATGALTSWLNPLPATGLAIDPTLTYADNTTTYNLGVYLQDQIKLPNNVFLLAGVRYQDVRKTGINTTPVAWGGTGTPAPDTPQHDSATTPRYGILWRACDWLSLYASHAENFGANNGVNWQSQPLPPEGAKQNEVGGKSEFFAGRLTSSVALYDLTKINVAVADIAHDPTGVLGYQTTLGAINSRGLEFDLQGEIQPGWNAIVSYTFDRVVITKSTPGSYYVQGNRMANDPEHMLRLWSTYSPKSLLLKGWRIGGGVTWRDSSLDGSNTVTSPSYAVWDTMASYEFKLGRQKASLQLNINNLFNAVYYTGAAIYGAYGTKFYGDPRSATASFRIEF